MASSTPKLQSTPSISHRKHIQWPPLPASEPTSTVVLTSSRLLFTDIRILLSSPPSRGTNDTLQWAFAGTSTSTSLTPSYPPRTAIGTEGEAEGNPQPASHSTWTHDIDSQTDNPAVDEGDMYPLPTGEVLEKGEMVNPETGKKAAYEELWADEDVGIVDGEERRRCVVLELADRGIRGRVVRVGKWCQGLVKSGSNNACLVERWEWKSPEESWTRTFRSGEGQLPCSPTWEAELIEGNTFENESSLWTVVEKYEW